MSNARSPRADCSTTIGTRLALITPPCAGTRTRTRRPSWWRFLRWARAVMRDVTKPVWTRRRCVPPVEVGDNSNVTMDSTNGCGFVNRPESSGREPVRSRS